MDSIQEFVFPTQFTDIMKSAANKAMLVKNVAHGKTLQFLQKNLNQMAQTMNTQPELLAECPDRFEFLFSLIHLQTTSVEVQAQLADLLTTNLTNVLTQDSEQVVLRLSLFLTLFFLSTQQHTTHQKELVSEDEEDEERRPTRTRKTNTIQEHTVKKMLKLVEDALKKVDQGYALMQLLLGALLPHLHLERAQSLLHKMLVVQFKTQSDHYEEQVLQRNVVETRMVQWAQSSQTNSQTFARLVMLLDKQIQCELIQMYLLGCLSTQRVGLTTQKPCRVFVVSMTKAFPAIFQNDTLLHTLLSYFENSNYYMRNSAVMGVTNLCMHNKLDEAINRQLIRLLLSRAIDQNAHCRSQVLVSLHAMIVDKRNTHISKPVIMEEILDIAVARMRDKSPYVRRSALSLLQCLIEYIIYCTNRFFFEVYKVQSKIGGQRLLTCSEAEKKQQSLLARRNTLLEDCGELQSILSGGAYNIKIELDDDDIEPRLNDLREALERNKEEEKFISKYLKFHDLILASTHHLKKLLQSRHTSEIIESVKVVLLLNKYQFEGHHALIKATMVFFNHITPQTLIYSRETPIREFIVSTFTQIYFQGMPEIIAEQILDLVKSCDLFESACLEQILLEISKATNIDKLVKHLWSQWTAMVKAPRHPAGEQQALIKALRMMVTSKPKHIGDRVATIDRLLKIYSSDHERVDFVVLREILLILVALQDHPKTHAVVQDLIVHIVNILTSCQGTEQPTWFTACEEAMRALFLFHDRPELVAEQVINRTTQFILQHKTQCSIDRAKERERNQQYMCDLQAPPDTLLYDQAQLVNDKSAQQCDYEQRLAQAFFAASTICIKLLVYTDTLKFQMNQLRQKISQKKSKKKDIEDEGEIDRIQGGTEAQHEAKLAQIDLLIETILVGRPAHLALACQKICQDILLPQPAQLRNAMLDQIAVLSLQQFMCCCRTFTISNLPLIFGLLEARHTSNHIKNNILIALGDNYFRYANEMEAYLPRLMSCLQDRETQIKRTALMVITHLILMDLLKTKADIGKIARMLNDPDPRISQQVRVFFIELNKKDQRALYLILPDLIGSMAYDLLVTEEDFLKFADEIIPLIEREKITEQLIEKFIERFMLYSQEADRRKMELSRREQSAFEEVIEFSPILLTAERECKFLAICLAHFQYNLINLRKLVQGYEYYRQFLSVESIVEQFKLILQRCRKTVVIQRATKRKSKQQNSVIQGHEMSATQEYNYLISMLEENISKFDKHYHLQKKLTGTSSSKKRQQSRRRRPQPKYTDMEVEQQIDYAVVNRPNYVKQTHQQQAVERAPSPIDEDSSLDIEC